MKQLFLLFMVFLYFIFGSCEDDITIENPDYTIGTIYEYVPGHTGIQTRVGFTYIINNEEFHNRYSHGDNGWDIPGNAGYEAGDKFMVEYDVKDVKVARMLFNYPVKDSADYIRYYNKLKNKQ